MGCEETTTPNVPEGSTAVEYDSFLLDRTEHLAPQGLPAAGAYTDQAMEDVPRGTLFVTYWVEYTRGGAGGYPAFRHETTNGVETNVREPLQDNSSLTTVQPNGSVDVLLEEIDGPQPVGAGKIGFFLRYGLPDWTTAARLRVSEKGNTASPGTVSIARTGSGGG